MSWQVTVILCVLSAWCWTLTWIQSSSVRELELLSDLVDGLETEVDELINDGIQKEKWNEERV